MPITILTRVPFLMLILLNLFIILRTDHWLLFSENQTVAMEGLESVKPSNKTGPMVDPM